MAYLLNSFFVTMVTPCIGKLNAETITAPRFLFLVYYAVLLLTLHSAD